MAAIMSRRHDQITEITKLMDECRSMGIATLGPDVNESFLKFGVNHHGEIRFGLAAIKGMGTSVAEAIINERNKNGLYKSIFDFAQRVSTSAVNRKAYESLALSGAFDGFGFRREQYFATDSRGNVFLDTLLRYGQLYQLEQAQAQNSLFGESAVEISTPPVPEGDTWSTIERLNRERDLVGIYLSAHPLDEYSVILNNLCNTRCDELDDKMALAKREEVTFGGIVTNVRSSMTRTGKPCGFVTIEDFNGSGELAFFGEEWGRWRGMLAEGYTVFIKAKCAARWRDSNQYDIRVSDIQYLQTVKDKSIEKITIMLDAQSIDETIVSDLTTIITENPGTTQLFFQIHHPESNSPILLRSKAKGINVKRELISYIESKPEMTYKIN